MPLGSAISVSWSSGATFVLEADHSGGGGELLTKSFVVQSEALDDGGRAV